MAHDHRRSPTDPSIPNPSSGPLLNRMASGLRAPEFAQLRDHRLDLLHQLRERDRQRHLVAGCRGVPRASTHRPRAAAAATAPGRAPVRLGSRVAIVLCEHPPPPRRSAARRAALAAPPLRLRHRLGTPRQDTGRRHAVRDRQGSGPEGRTRRVRGRPALPPAPRSIRRSRQRWTSPHARPVHRRDRVRSPPSSAGRSRRSRRSRALVARAALRSGSLGPR